MNTALNISSFQLIKILREKVGEEQAETLANFVESKVHEEYESKKEGFATKEDISHLKEDILRLETKVESTKADIIKWMFIFWIGQIATVFAFIKFVK